MTDTTILDYPLPEHEGNRTQYEGKFLQFVLDGREYLVFAPSALHRYHNQILAHFLEDNGIPHRWLSRDNLAAEARDLRVIGGGRFRVDTQARTLALWDNSQAYGRFNEEGLPERIARADHPWSGFELRIV